MCPSSVQAFIEEELAPELLDLTLDEAGLESPPLLLASVDELDFAEDKLFVDEDETLLLDLSPLPSLVPSLLLRISLDEDSFSGSTKLLLSSSPQATNRNVNANANTRRTVLAVILAPRGSIRLEQALETRVMDPPSEDDVDGSNFFILNSMEISRPKFNLFQKKTPLEAGRK